MISHLFFQLAVLLGACQVIAYVLRRLQQPPVIGQMIAGLVLGPSLLGLVFPSVQSLLFPQASLTIIRGLGQLGLVLYMFVVGTELNHGLLRRHIKGATAVSVTGDAVPLLVGVVAALFIAGNRDLFPAGVSPLTATLFFAAAMSVTAFPVMARLIVERNLVGTTVANVALTAGSVSDAVAWCLLALVIATLSGTLTGLVVTVSGAMAFTALVILVARPALRRLLGDHALTSGNTTWPFASLLMVVLLAGWTTEAIGIHPAFGAFLVGAVAPRNEVVSQLTAKITPLASNLLLPLFFVYAGLNTRVDLVNTEQLVVLMLGVILLACGSKGIACWLAARFAGFGVRDAAAIGALMNARGLVELIILTTALEHGVITPTLFSIMVVMAVVTTVMASPALRLIYGAQRSREQVVFTHPQALSDTGSTLIPSSEREPASA